MESQESLEKLGAIDTNDENAFGGMPSYEIPSQILRKLEEDNKCNLALAQDPETRTSELKDTCRELGAKPHILGVDIKTPVFSALAEDGIFYTDVLMEFANKQTNDSFVAERFARRANVNGFGHGMIYQYLEKQAQQNHDLWRKFLSENNQKYQIAGSNYESVEINTFSKPGIKFSSLVCGSGSSSIKIYPGENGTLYVRMVMAIRYLLLGGGVGGKLESKDKKPFFYSDTIVRVCHDQKTHETHETIVSSRIVPVDKITYAFFKINKSEVKKRPPITGFLFYPTLCLIEAGKYQEFKSVISDFTSEKLKMLVKQGMKDLCGGDKSYNYEYIVKIFKREFYGVSMLDGAYLNELCKSAINIKMKFLVPSIANRITFTDMLTNFTSDDDNGLKKILALYDAQWFRKTRQVSCQLFLSLLNKFAAIQDNKHHMLIDILKLVELYLKAIKKADAQSKSDFIDIDSIKGQKFVCMLIAWVAEQLGIRFKKDKGSKIDGQTITMIEKSDMANIIDEINRIIKDIIMFLDAKYVQRSQEKFDTIELVIKLLVKKEYQFGSHPEKIRKMSQIIDGLFFAKTTDDFVVIFKMLQEAAKITSGTTSRSEDLAQLANSVLNKLLAFVKPDSDFNEQKTIEACKRTIESLSIVNEKDLSEYDNTDRLILRFRLAYIFFIQHLEQTLNKTDKANELKLLLLEKLFDVKINCDRALLFASLSTDLEKLIRGMHTSCDDRKKLEIPHYVFLANMYIREYLLRQPSRRTVDSIIPLSFHINLKKVKLNKGDRYYPQLEQLRKTQRPSELVLNKSEMGFKKSIRYFLWQLRFDMTHHNAIIKMKEYRDLLDCINGNTDNLVTYSDCMKHLQELINALEHNKMHMGYEILRSFHDRSIKKQNKLKEAFDKYRKENPDGRFDQVMSLYDAYRQIQQDMLQDISLRMNSDEFIEMKEGLRKPFDYYDISGYLFIDDYSFELASLTLTHDNDLAKLNCWFINPPQQLTEKQKNDLKIAYENLEDVCESFKTQVKLIIEGGRLTFAAHEYIRGPYVLMIRDAYICQRIIKFLIEDNYDIIKAATFEKKEIKFIRQHLNDDTETKCKLFLDIEFILVIIESIYRNRNGISRLLDDVDPQIRRINNAINYLTSTTATINDQTEYIDRIINFLIDKATNIFHDINCHPQISDRYTAVSSYLICKAGSYCRNFLLKKKSDILTLTFCLEFSNACARSQIFRKDDAVKKAFFIKLYRAFAPYFLKSQLVSDLKQGFKDIRNLDLTDSDLAIGDTKEEDGSSTIRNIGKSYKGGLFNRRSGTDVSRKEVSDEPEPEPDPDGLRP